MLQINFKPFPELSTERLLLRQINKNDEQEVFIIRSDKETMQYIPRPVAATLEDASRLIQKMDELLNKTEAINWAITLRDDPKLIGIIGFYRIAAEHYRGEVGYIMKPEHRGKGIMHEALIKVLDFGFSQIKFHCIEAIVDPQNTPSSKLLERNGFTQSGYFKEREFFNGKFIDTLYYHLITPINKNKSNYPIPNPACHSGGTFLQKSTPSQKTPTNAIIQFPTPAVIQEEPFYKNHRHPKKHQPTQLPNSQPRLSFRRNLFTKINTIPKNTNQRNYPISNPGCHSGGTFLQESTPS